MATLSAPCPHCNHDKSLFESVWNSYPKDGKAQVYLTCIHCGKGIGIIAEMRRSAAQPSEYRGNIEDFYKITSFWPLPRMANAPEYTPKPVATRFLDGEDAFSRGRWTSAVAMYRSALDIATKGMPDVPMGKTFFERLQWLHREGKITQDIKDWADQVRVEGNGALHDPEEFSEGDATTLRFFTEMFLRYVFELPGKVQAFQSQKEE